jgi:hypothetical protein
MRRLTRRILGPWRWLCLREARYTRRLRNIERHERQREQRLKETVASFREAFERMQSIRAEEHNRRLREIGFN